MSNPADRIGKAKGSITVAGASDINKYPDNLMLDKDYCKKDTFIGNVYNRCVLITH